MEVFSLETSIKLDLDGFKKQLKEAQGELDKFGSGSGGLGGSGSGGNSGGFWGAMDNGFTILMENINTFKQALEIVKTPVNALTGLFTNFGKEVVKIFDSAIKVGKEFATVLSETIVSGAKVATEAVTAVSVGVAAVVGGSVATGMNFEQSMAQVLATAGTTRGSGDYNRLKKAAEDAGRSTKFTAAQSADALNYLLLAGYGVDNSINVLPAMLNLAAAGGLDLGYAAKISTDAMNSMGLAPTLENFEHFGDVLATVQTTTNTTIGELGEALRYAAPIAKEAHISLEDTATLLGVLANAGFHGNQGGIMLRNLLSNMYLPDKKSKAIMEEFGLNPYVDSQTKDVFSYLEDFLSVLENASSDEEVLEMFSGVFDRRTIAAASSAIRNREKLQSVGGAINSADGSMAQMSKTMLNTLEGDIITLKSRLQDIGNTIYDVINKPLREAAQLAINFIDNLKAAFDRGGFAALGVEAGNVIRDGILNFAENAPAVVGTVTKFLRSLIASLRNKMPEMTAVLTEVIPVLFEDIANTFILFFNSANTAKGGIINLIMVVIKSFLDNYAAVIEVLADVVPQILEAIATSVSENKDGLLIPIRKIIASILTAVSDSAPSLLDIGADFLTSLLETMAYTTGVVAAVAEKILDDITLLLANEEFKNSVSESISTMVSNIKSIIGDILGFINGGSNVQFFVDLFQNALRDITAALDEIMPDIMAAISYVTTKIMKLFLEDLVPFEVFFHALGIVAFKAFWNGIVGAIGEKLQKIKDDFLGPGSTVAEVWKRSGMADLLNLVSSIQQEEQQQEEQQPKGIAALVKKANDAKGTQTIRENISANIYVTGQTFEEAWDDFERMAAEREIAYNRSFGGT